MSNAGQYIYIHVHNKNDILHFIHDLLKVHTTPPCARISQYIGIQENIWPHFSFVPIALVVSDHI